MCGIDFVMLGIHPPASLGGMEMLISYDRIWVCHINFSSVIRSYFNTDEFRSVVKHIALLETLYFIVFV